jgi:hypothetical protein
MQRFIVALLAVAAAWAVSACSSSDPSVTSPDLLSAAGGTNRPFKGSCAVTVTTRAHEEGEEGGSGGMGGGEESPDGGHEDEGGGPPIPRRYDVTGQCDLTHLGYTIVTGRLNVTGPMTPGGGHDGGEEHDVTAAEGEAGGGMLGVRGHLVLTADNGAVLSGRYLPVNATVTPAAAGGTLNFSSTLLLGRSAPGHEGDGEDGFGGMGEGEGGEFPPSTGRFADASGQATMNGALVIDKVTKSGTGTFVVVNGLISY